MKPKNVSEAVGSTWKKKENDPKNKGKTYRIQKWPQGREKDGKLYSTEETNSRQEIDRRPVRRLLVIPGKREEIGEKEGGYSPVWLLWSYF